MRRVVVLGAGVAGLSTAVRLQEILQTSDVTITLVSDAFGADTTSFGAAGLFRPTPDLMPGVEPHTLRKWIDDSWKFYESVAQSSEAGKAGINYLSGYHLYNEGEAYIKEPNILAELALSYREMTDKEHDVFKCERRNRGIFFTTLLIEPRFYLQWLMNRFLSRGGHVIKKTATSFSEFAGECDVLVNCTGLRSRRLQADPALTANRGQVMRVKAPWLKHFVYVDMNCWIIPGAENVVVGGTRQADNDDTSISQKDQRDVWERACTTVPSLRYATIEKVWPGLRPYRKDGVRIEVETLQEAHPGKPLHVVHHYGHGGNGIAVSWGTAIHAADLVAKVLGQQQITAKL